MKKTKHCKISIIALKNIATITNSRSSITNQNNTTVVVGNISYLMGVTLIEADDGKTVHEI